MRDIRGSFHTSSGSSAGQILSTDRPLVYAVTLKARAGNSGDVYVGHNSSVSSTNGWHLDPGDVFEASYDVGDRPGGIKGTSFWVTATDTAQVLDYWITLED